MQEALVSVIMPSYNGEKYIADSIDSILAQTYRNWELIITDDCSSDSTQDIIKDYMSRDSRIRGFFFDKNQGSGASRNNCIKEARGRYIAFCDCDDRCRDHCRCSSSLRRRHIQADRPDLLAAG